ncbi:CHC2 zinc finger domain-containing protein [Chloroflexota bacterium]
MRIERPLDEQELSRPAMLLAQRFAQRWDVYARQLDDGRYICVYDQLDVDHLSTHLRGEITLGTYILNKESQARFIVFDDDRVDGFDRLALFAQSLEKENIPSYLERSRRGGHLWLFLMPAISGRDTRLFAHGLMAANDITDVEVFPKQDKVKRGPGSLIRMPFGIHKISRRRYNFYCPDGLPLVNPIKQQIHALSAPKIVPNEVLETYIPYLPSKSKTKAYSNSQDQKSTPSEQIKANISVLEFISQYIDLKPTDRGAIGLCPFHDDHQPSLGINDEENYWNCFAGCGGGSIIDFWVKWRECDFDTAVKELINYIMINTDNG